MPIDVEPGERTDRRGRHAKYQTRCDCCGRFVLPGQPGSSWVMVPAIDVPGHQSGDERERCAKCTEKFGPAECSSAYVKKMCCGVMPEEVRNEQ